MPIPIILAGVGKVLLGKTVKTAVARAVEKVADDQSIPGVRRADAVPVATAVIDALAQDKTFVNATNSEPAYQSRVAWGAVIAALGVAVPPLAKLLGFEVNAADIVTYGGAIITLGGAAFVLYGRFAKGLRPLFSGKK